MTENLSEHVPNPAGADPLFVSKSTEPTAPAPDSFAAKLKAAREAAGLSKNKASQLLKITNATLNNYEQGKTKPSPHRGGAMLRKLKDALLVEANAQPDPQPAEVPELTDDEWKAGKPFPGVSDPGVVPDHDPYDPVPDFDTAPEIPTQGQSPEILTLLPDIPVGNVHTTQDGVIRRRLADDDEREGLELIGGRKWFTVGFAPPHPRAKPVNKPAATPPPAPLSSPVERPEPRVHTETTPVAPEPAEAIPAPALSGQRNWAWWNR